MQTKIFSLLGFYFLDLSFSFFCKCHSVIHSPGISIFFSMSFQAACYCALTFLPHSLHLLALTSPNNCSCYTQARLRMTEHQHKATGNAHSAHFSQKTSPKHPALSPSTTGPSQQMPTGHTSHSLEDGHPSFSRPGEGTAGGWPRAGRGIAGRQKVILRIRQLLTGRTSESSIQTSHSSRMALN